MIYINYENVELKQYEKKSLEISNQLQMIGQMWRYKDTSEDLCPEFDRLIAESEEGYKYMKEMPDYIYPIGIDLNTRLLQLQLLIRRKTFDDPRMKNVTHNTLSMELGWIIDRKKKELSQLAIDKEREFETEV